MLLEEQMETVDRGMDRENMNQDDGELQNNAVSGETPEIPEDTKDESEEMVTVEGKETPGGEATVEGRESTGGEGTTDAAREASLKEELEKAKKEIADFKDAWTRERAEFLNYKKRVAQEQVRTRNQLVSKFVSDLLPVLDNLDRVLQVDAEDPAIRNFVSGVEMIRKEFLAVLEKEKIKTLRPQGEVFDPYIMEAIAMEEREGIEKDTVVEVYQVGFYFESESGEKQVIRPARVKVGKPAVAK